MFGPLREQRPNRGKGKRHGGSVARSRLLRAASRLGEPLSARDGDCSIDVKTPAQVGEFRTGDTRRCPRLLGNTAFYSTARRPRHGDARARSGETGRQPVNREGCARAYIGCVKRANLVKLGRFEARISYLSYPAFDDDPHPALAQNSGSWPKKIRAPPASSIASRSSEACVCAWSCAKRGSRRSRKVRQK
jgi:hypothetical protein